MARYTRPAVACLISPVAVWPAQKTRPGTLTAGPDSRVRTLVCASRGQDAFHVLLTVVRLGGELFAGDELAGHGGGEGSSLERGDGCDG